MAKPLLYHGSPAKIAKFIPRDGFDAGRVPYFGTMATDSKPLATLFALKLKEGFNPATGHGALGGVKDAIGNDAKDFNLAANLFGDTIVSIFRNRSSYLAALEKNGGGGYLYRMPTDTFRALPRPTRTPTTEWLSAHREIAPIAVERVTLDSAMRSGSQILFLKDGIDVDKLIHAHLGEWDEGSKQLALYKKLIKEGVLTNENATRGIPNSLGLPVGPDAGQNMELTWARYVEARRSGRNIPTPP